MTRLLLVSLLFLPLNLGAQFTAPEYAQRRESLAARLPGSAVLVVLGAREPPQDYVQFYQNPGMLYLSGVKEPGTALVLVKDSLRLSEMLFVLARDPTAETWTGMRLGTDGATKLTNIRARERSTLTQALDSLAGRTSTFFVLGERTSGDEGTLTADEQYLTHLQKRHPQLQIASADQLLQMLRGKKLPVSWRSSGALRKLQLKRKKRRCARYDRV